MILPIIHLAQVEPDGLCMFDLGVPGLTSKDGVFIKAQGDNQTLLQLYIGHRIVSSTVIDGSRRVVKRRPDVYHFGGYSFLIFRKALGTSEFTDVVMLDPARRALKPMGSFKNGWSPDFSKTGAIYSFEPELGGFNRTVWRWDSKSKSLSARTSTHVTSLPPLTAEAGRAVAQ